ncbi:MAG: proline--tRNA ligase [Anaerolineae bacterium]|nr:proline--tRNA ligase [Anaerolineae bacterium]
MTKLFSNTAREAPSEAQVTSHQLLLRAGFIRQHAAGIFSALPLGYRASHKIEKIVREEMDAIGGQEIKMPVVNPAELWQETGRWSSVGAELGRFKDRTDRDMVLAMTHEEAVTDLVRQEIQSYRQLPMLVYHIQTKWRDDPRPRAGLIRVREFTMKDSYSLDADEAGLDAQYRAHYQAYFNIFRRCGLDPIAVGSDTGMMGGSMAHEFMALTPVGEDTLLLCDACGYAANRQVARFRKPPAVAEAAQPMEKIATPGVTTIEDLTAFLDIPAARTAKAVFMIATVSSTKPGDTHVEDRDTFVFAIVRGDMEVNETKLANAVGAKALRPATEAEIRATGAEPGYGSPIGVHGAHVVVDDAVVASPNLVAGANKVGYHIRHVNVGRDFVPDVITDIAAAGDGDACPACGAAMRAARGVEIGNIFKLGTRYSEAMGATYADEAGEPHPVVMGSYGIGIGRALACIAETHNDDYGLIWPVTVAPYHVHLLTLGPEGSEARAAADALYDKLVAAGIEVLYDDRDRSPGVKFNDADLIGLPLRITVARRGLAEDSVEFKLRHKEERSLVSLEAVIPTIQAKLAALEEEIVATLRPETFKDGGEPPEERRNE